MNPYSGTRYATDAYPGFDDSDEVVTSEKKTPRWFGWINGVAKTNAAEQMALAVAREGAKEWRAARRAYDSLVREWPQSPEAPRAQEALARILCEEEGDYERGFREYKYLLDFYPSQCGFESVADTLYRIANEMRRVGKRFMFKRFANTTVVRRAFEAAALRSPGAKWAPAALLAVGELREDEGEWEKAVLVYENLRSQHSASDEARAALVKEGAARMKLLRMHGYNRERAKDTESYLRMALAAPPPPSARADLEKWLAETTRLLDEEAWAAAKFYDSRTRTKRSAVEAYERFLSDNPASSHAMEARARLQELKGGTGK